MDAAYARRGGIERLRFSTHKKGEHSFTPSTLLRSYKELSGKRRSLWPDGRGGSLERE